MTTLTIEFPKAVSQVIDRLISQGYFKTKAEAVRASVLLAGQHFDKMQAEHDRLNKLVEDAVYEDYKAGVNRKHVSR